MTHENPDKRSEMRHRAPKLRIAWARLVLIWEKFWPAALPGLLPVALFLIVSLFDGWRFVSMPVHWLAIALTIFGAGFGWFAAFRHIDWPDHRDAVARVERDSAFRHAPLQAADDQLFADDVQNDAAHALWLRHQDQMARLAKQARVKGAYATADRADPFALRFSVLGLIILGIFAAGPSMMLRLGAAVQPGTARQTIASRADLWIDPPTYTGLAPIYLVRGGDDLPELSDQINVPAGSKLTALINGERGADLTLTHADGTTSIGAPPATDSDQNPLPSQNGQQGARARRVELILDESGVVQLRLAGKRGLWPVSVQVDSAPVVVFVTPPAPNKKRQLDLYYTFTDDYGAASAALIFRLDPEQQRPLDSPAFEQDALNEIRTLSLDGAQGPSGERKHSVNLDEDPWAGLKVIARVVVTDGAGQTGHTAEVSIDLPSRPFFNPLAKAVIEQRQSLSVAGDAIQKVRDAFAGLTLVPEEFYEDTAEYLLLSTAFWRVQTEKDGQYDDIVEHFWPLALELEDQALELARRRLDAAIEALRQALEQGASETVVDQRRADLEQAIQDYLQALAQAGIPEGEGGGEGSNQLGANQLQEMLDGIGELSKSGANNAARQLLSDLENILNNLQLSRGGSGQGGIPGGSGGEGDGPGEQAGELIGRQRDLSDRSFERGQQGDGDGGDLANEQGEIGQALQELLQSLQEGAGGEGGNDPDPDGTAERALKDALREMAQSQDALDADQFGRAGNAMDRAISKLREGAQALAEAKSGQNGQAQDGGEQGQSGDGVDPLGRTTGGTGGGNVAVPDIADPALTRDVIEELRRRLGEQGRSKEEIDYLERLLEAF